MFNAGTLIICSLAAFALGWISGEWKSEIRYHKSIMELTEFYRKEISGLVQKIKRLESEREGEKDG